MNDELSVWVGRCSSQCSTRGGRGADRPSHVLAAGTQPLWGCVRGDQTKKDECISLIPDTLLVSHNLLVSYKLLVGWPGALHSLRDGRTPPCVWAGAWVGNSAGNSDVEGNSDIWYRDRPRDPHRCSSQCSKWTRGRSSLFGNSHSTAPRRSLSHRKCL